VRHYNFLTAEQRSHLFLHEPEEFDFTSDPFLLSNALGATLYCPATRPNLMHDIEKMAIRGAGSIVICLEDSIPDDALPMAEENLHNTLLALKERGDVSDLPLIFVRIRDAEHLHRVGEQNKGLLDSLTGFVFPKFENMTGSASRYVSMLRRINLTYSRPLFFMPVLESPNLVHLETRTKALSGIKKVLDANRELVLAVRIGATDMSSVYGIRRNPDFTVWDVGTISNTITDIINVFGRFEDSYTITGAVWEHFSSGERIFKPQLRQSLFGEGWKLRRDLLNQGDDTFIREIQQDKINGIFGKTIIHPSHIRIVHSLSVVSHEEYADALDITDTGRKHGGAASSFYKNKMNEIKPHYAWATKTLLRAKAFGVSNQGIEFPDLLEASPVK